ncbi:MAG: DUF3352 domain-containing protein [Treponema sp.]|nr:DUF3352 domain-containing protein [Treponema sp.]
MKKKEKKSKRLLKCILIPVCILAFIFLVWTAFSLIGRVDAGSVIPENASLRVTVSNSARLIDGLLTHETLQEISAVPELAQMTSAFNMLKENPFLKNRLFRIAARGKIEFALLPSETGKETITAAWDMGFFSPLLRILPAVSGFVNIPDLYYVQAGKNSRFEYRLDNMTLFIGPYRNLLFITSSSSVFESRNTTAGSAQAFNAIDPSGYDAALLLSPEFINALLANQDPGIAAILDTIKFDSMAEAGLSIQSKKLELRLAAPLASSRPALNRFIEQRSQVSDMTELLPASAQYATILSAGTLDELYQAALVYSPALEETLRTAENASRSFLRLTLNDLLFSWSGKEFAVFGIEGRPHPVYAIQISDERKRQEVFDRAFRSIVLNEDIRLNLDGMRIPRIEVPDFLQSLLRRWNIYLPSPYYIIYKDFLFASESADALLSALRAMQRNDVLARTEAWRDIAGGKPASSAFSLYYSLDLSMPFFLRNNTVLSGFLSLYRQGLVRMGFDRGLLDLSLSLVPGSGNGVTLVSGYPLALGIKQSNQVFGSGTGVNSRIFLVSDGYAVSIDPADNTVHTFSGQAAQWVVPADRDGRKPAVNAWVVSDRGRVTLVNGNMEPSRGFPVLTGLRLSSAPYVFDGKLYLCDEGGKIHTVDENGNLGVLETSFAAAVRSPPSFLALSSRNVTRNYAAVYPKSFFGEIWLLEIQANSPRSPAGGRQADGKALPNWPAPASPVKDDFSFSAGIGFGSPLLFAHNNSLRAAFVCQDGELVIYDENAGLVSPFPLSLDGIFYLQPVFDGEYLWLISSEGTLFRVSLEGEILSQNIPGFSVKEEGYITVFDCDGDGVPEVFVTGDGNALYAYTRHFRSLEGFPLPVWGRPFFVDAQTSFGGSKKAEVFGIGMDQRLYRWQFK